MASFNKKAHLRQNVEAIRIAFALDREQRKPTEDEQEILSSYSGFGGIKAILNPMQGEDATREWSKVDLELYPLVKDLHDLLRENSADEKEYKKYFDSLKNSILTAFYTPQVVIDTLSHTLLDAGVAPTRFLDPSAGVGAFVSSFKEAAPQAEIFCFEKDLLTGKILSHLYPGEKVRVEGYEKMEGKYAQYFDVIASNIPFGDTAVFDPLLSKHELPIVQQATKSIHNYFFVKSMMAAREGGLVAFITSQGVLNSEKNKAIREHLMRSCTLVSAIRLPNNLFTEHAGTEVGSDLIILQRKNTHILPTPRQQQFIESRKLSNGISINNLFSDFSRVVQTQSKVDTDPYGQPAIIFTHEGGVEGIAKDLRKMLSEDFSKHLDLDRYLSHAPDKQEQETKRSEPISLSPSVQKDVRQEQTHRTAYEPIAEDLVEFYPFSEAINHRVLREHTISQPSQIKMPTQEELKPEPNPEVHQKTTAEKKEATIQQQPTTEFVAMPDIQQQPILSLYDLFDFSAVERSQINRPKGKGRNRTKELSINKGHKFGEIM